MHISRIACINENHIIGAVRLIYKPIVPLICCEGKVSLVDWMADWLADFFREKNIVGCWLINQPNKPIFFCFVVK